MQIISPQIATEVADGWLQTVEIGNTSEWKLTGDPKRKNQRQFCLHNAPNIDTRMQFWTQSKLGAKRGKHWERHTHEPRLKCTKEFSQDVWAAVVETGICQDILKEQCLRGLLAKMSISGQIGSEILAQLCSENCKQTLLNLVFFYL